LLECSHREPARSLPKEIEVGIASPQRARVSIHVRWCQTSREAPYEKRYRAPFFYDSGSQAGLFSKWNILPSFSLVLTGRDHEQPISRRRPSLEHMTFGRRRLSCVGLGLAEGGCVDFFFVGVPRIAAKCRHTLVWSVFF